jgi:hypothetical protein
MSENTRIYLVVNRATDERRLVEAITQAQAIRHCVSTLYRADVASAKVVAKFMEDGLKIEKASSVMTTEYGTQTLPPTTTQPNEGVRV